MKKFVYLALVMLMVFAIAVPTYAATSRVLSNVVNRSKLLQNLLLVDCRCGFDYAVNNRCYEKASTPIK